MTMLMQWLVMGSIFMAPWLAIVTKQMAVSEEFVPIVLFYPLAFIALFAVYTVALLAWRVYTFNDCEDAAKELHEHIAQAKKDLQLKGFKFEAVSE